MRPSGLRAMPGRQADVLIESTRLATATAAARITDADIATESAELARTRILQQSAAAVLAQANLKLQLALHLLRV